MIEFYDSLTGEKRAFHKEVGETVSMYVCGPTVYDHAHLGHGRSAVAFDLIRRTLLWLGYKVVFAFNITDIDDKMIDRANSEGITVKELTEKITPEYKKDYGDLGILPPTHNPYATEYVEEMIRLIEILEEKGHTYVLEDGVYYDVTTFPEYGKLSHQNLDALKAGARVQAHDGKRNSQDFVLWKFKKPGEPSWESPWGEGRPGWHIECSAMSSKLLGTPFDIHGGGLDLKFPHHECEIAQSEAALGTQNAHFWMHNGYITVNEEKMSKSLGNFFTLKEIFKQFHPRVVRFFLLGTHYRSPIEFSHELLDQARSTLRRLDEFYLKNNGGGLDSNFLDRFKNKLMQDMDLAGALAELFEWMNSNPKEIRGTLDSLNQVLNIFPSDFQVSSEAQNLIVAREKARQEKDWARSDELRSQLLEMGIEVEDGKEGSFARPAL